MINSPYVTPITSITKRYNDDDDNVDTQMLRITWTFYGT